MHFITPVQKNWLTSGCVCKFALWQVLSSETMNELLKAKELQLHNDGYIHFNAGELEGLSSTAVDQIKQHFHGVALMMLPDTEKSFFAWLKENDRPVWDDLWGNEERLYLVSIDLLHHFTHEGNGFPICDLVDEDNYWFHSKHIKNKGYERLETLAKQTSYNSNLPFEEVLLLDIIQNSIDIWHFCYKYSFPLQTAKRKVDEMHRSDLLVHLPNREDLVKYLDV